MGQDNVKFSKPVNAKWCVVTRETDKHLVFAPDGSLYGTYATLSQARATVGIRQKEADQAARRTTRACMRCQKAFDSDGIHNRMCSVCRHASGEWDPYGLAPRSGRAR